MASFRGLAGRIEAVTLANADLPRYPTFGILVGTAGTLNCMDAAGNTLTGVPVQAGYNPLSLRQCRTGGTAANIWALYEG